MSVTKLKADVIKLIDDGVEKMSQAEYLEFLEDLTSDLELRIEAVEDEIEDE